MTEDLYQLLSVPGRTGTITDLGGTESPHLLNLDIPGDPVGQGSITMYRSGGSAYPKHTVEHRNLVITTLRDTWAGRPPVLAAVSVHVQFVFTRPKAHWLPANRRRPNPVLKVDAPVWHTATPDCDKCERLVGDGLEIAGVLGSDKLIARWFASKRWGATGSTRLRLHLLH